MDTIRPSSDLRNKYNEISSLCKESKEPIYITVNGRGDTVLMGYHEFKQQQAELELLKTLAEAEDDVMNGRVSEMQETFHDIRTKLARMKKGVL